MSVTLTAPAYTPALVLAAPAPLVQLFLSAIQLPANYRQGMDQTALQDLAASLLSKGQLQPVLVRPLLGDEASAEFSHELVFGNRRFAAHELAGLATITATEQIMTAQEAEEMRLIENVQRENPHPADEARAVAKLLENGANRAEVAARLGKSPKWVAQRQALGALVAEWFEALRQDRLTLVAAEELSRWPHPVQARVWERYGKVAMDAKLSLETIRWAVSDEQHNLSAAPWQLTDPDLVPAAGACFGCPKRSSCVKDLFAPEAVGKKDLCLDKACWATKLDAQIAKLLAERSTEQQPAIRISCSYGSGEGKQALSMSRYEIVNKKKDAIPAVLVDGPHAGHGRYITLIGEVLTVSLGGVPIIAATPKPSKGEQMKETRRKKLLKEARKQVIASRLMSLVAADPAEARPVVEALLVDMIAQQLLRNRIRVDELTLKSLQTTWKWAAAPEKAIDSAKWVREQIVACTPTDGSKAEKLIFLLMYVTINHDLGAEYSDYQSELAKRLNLPQVLDELAPATEAQLASEYDSNTLRRLKQAA